MSESRVSDLDRFTSRRRIDRPDVLGDEDLADLATVSPQAHAAAVLVWSRRVDNESGSCEVARRLITTAKAIDLDAPIIAALERLLEDEEVHAALAREVLASLGRPDHVAAEVLGPLPVESAERSFVRQVVAALCVAESVSAARYAAVREATDMAVPHASIDLFLRDEVLHGKLGFDLLPEALRHLERSEPNAAPSFVDEILRDAFRSLDLTVGMDCERRGMPKARPQPTGNPGVVEPAIDALAFYDAIHRTVLPSFTAHSTALGAVAEGAWTRRFGDAK